MEDAISEKTKCAPAKPDLQPDLDQSHSKKEYLIEKLLATVQTDNNTIQNEVGFGAEADPVSSNAYATEYLIDEIDYIFECAKEEALNVIESAKRKAQDCVRKAMRQETSPGFVQNNQPDSASVRNEIKVNNTINVPCEERMASFSVKKMTEMIENGKFLSNTEEVERNGSEPEQDEHVSDKDDAMEVVIKDNLERYKAYISDCVKATDLIAFCDLFTTAQTKELRRIYRRSPNEATEKAFEEISLMHDQSEKYRRLLSALKDTGYPKVVQILEGIIIPVGRRHRVTIRNCAKHIFQRLNTAEVLPYLYSKGIISADDKQQIQRTERTESTGIAALELLDLLPNRIKRWYRYIIDSLVESGHDDLAKIIEENTKQAIAVRRKRNKLGYSSDGLKEMRVSSEKAVHSKAMLQNYLLTDIKEPCSPASVFSERSCVRVNRFDHDESEFSDSDIG